MAAASFDHRPVEAMRGKNNSYVIIKNNVDNYTANIDGIFKQNTKTYSAF